MDLGKGGGGTQCSLVVAAGPPVGSVLGLQQAGGLAGQPALQVGWLLLLHVLTELHASPGGAALVLPALQPETVLVAQTLKPRLPALTSSGSAKTGMETQFHDPEEPSMIPSTHTAAHSHLYITPVSDLMFFFDL